MHSKQERARTSKDYIICREITAVLKITMDAINLELCDSRDYFVGKGNLHFRCQIHREWFPNFYFILERSDFSLEQNDCPVEPSDPKMERSDSERSNLGLK